MSWVQYPGVYSQSIERHVADPASPSGVQGDTPGAAMGDTSPRQKVPHTMYAQLSRQLVRGPVSYISIVDEYTN